MTTYRINRSVIVNASRTGRLDLHGLSLDSVPLELFDNPLLVENLHTLDLSSNRLTSLPADLAKLTKLKELHLDDNKFASLPIELCDLPSLKAISIENNPLPAPLLNLYNRARSVHSASGRGREVTPVLQYILQHEESALQQEASKLDDINTPQPLSTTSSAAVSPINSRPSSADSDSSIASRYKQAALASNPFASSTAEPVHSKKHHSASHTPSNVFSCATQAYDGHTGKRVHTAREGSAMNAPFGTDNQPLEEVKPRRMGREESEKENEVSNTTKNAPYAHINNEPINPDTKGKRYNRDHYSSQSPFATMPTATSYETSSRPTTPAFTPPVLPDPVVKKATDSVGMSSALSHLSVGEAPVQRRGIRIVNQGVSDIFGTGEQVQAKVETGRRGHPSAESVHPVEVQGGAYVQRGGRARVNHGQKDTQLW